MSEAAQEIVERSFTTLTHGLFDALDLAECQRCHAVVREIWRWDHLMWHQWLDEQLGAES